MVPAADHQIFDGRRTVPDQVGPRALVHGPHDAVGALADVIERPPAGENFPEDYAPAEDVAFLRVARGTENLQRGFRYDGSSGSTEQTQMGNITEMLNLT